MISPPHKPPTLPLPLAPIRKKVKAKAKRTIRLEQIEVLYEPLPSPDPVVSDADTDTGH